MDLYALPPEQFTAARDAEAKAARAGGDRERAKELAALRRPALPAYAVNALVRREPALLEDLLALGPQLAAAQAGGDAAALRALGEQRRALVVAVAERAHAAADRPLSSAAREEVAATLEAALADPASADAVRSGRLVRPLTYAGFGPVDLSEAVGPPVAGAPTVEPRQAPEAGASGKSVGPARGRAGRAAAPGATAREPAAARPAMGSAAVTSPARSAAAKPAPTAKQRQAQERERQAQERERQAQERERQAQERERQAQERRLQAVREAEAAALTAGGRLDDAASAMTAAGRTVESAAAALKQAQRREAAAAAALEEATVGRTAAQAALREARRHADSQAAAVRRAQARADDARRALDALRRGLTGR